MRAHVLLAVLVAGCASKGPPPAATARCVLPAGPTVIKHDDHSVLQRWDVAADAVWFSKILPDDPKYLAYRRAITDAEADLERPIADDPAATTDEERENWKRERANADLVFGGLGHVRPVQCLDAALFAYQHARHDQLAQPTELIAMVLRSQDGTRLRIYFAGSDQMFPPKAFYGLDEAARDVAAGWRLAVHLHNHTIQERAGRHALGTPAPSTSDVSLLRGVAADLGLATVWVTNGFYTGEVPASALDRLSGRD